MVITVDTMILIWGVRAWSEPHDAAMIPKAKAFLEWVDRHNHSLCLTTVAVSEYLIGGDSDQR